MKRTIEQFLQKYDSFKAIQWYTKDTFIYRLINMTLRTDNILIIFKFRFIVQDIYTQLKHLYEEQEKTSCLSKAIDQISELKFYRGQRISSTELSKLEHGVGSMISMTRKCYSVWVLSCDWKQ